MFHPNRDVRITIPQLALNAIFDECDQFDDHETGGRILGTYKQDAQHLHLAVRALIDSGPRARRSAVSFFQDGEYQEMVFRQIETQHPEIEHLGNWHTHHMNGLQHLSSGDLGTYQRIVNHPNHNTPFFYALLVTTKRKSRDPLDRYEIKHYLFRRDDPKAYEIPSRQIEIVDSPVLALAPSNAHPTQAQPKRDARPDLVGDQEFIAEFFREVRPYQSATLGLYWRGPMILVNGTRVEAVIVEDTARTSNRYSITVRDAQPELADATEELTKKEFPSVRSALVIAERICNRSLYSHVIDADKRSTKQEIGGTAMEVLTLYVGQGSLTAIRSGNEVLIIDAHMPECEDVGQAEIENTLETFIGKRIVCGLVLTGLDKDHACPSGVDSILSRYKPAWVMYPKYYKDTDAASDVFKTIEGEVTRRARTSSPLERKSVHVQRVDARYLSGLSSLFKFELFSPHMDDMDSSNNSSIVLKITGLDPSGFSYLVTGDTEKERWESINRYFGAALTSDVMAAPHHGARTGVNVRSLELIRPNTVLISAGVDNAYGHPYGSAVKVYQQMAKHVFSTHAEGGHCLLTRRSGQDFATALVTHVKATGAETGR